MSLPAPEIDWLIYEEKLVENFIRDYPKEFLGEELSLWAQQPLIGGFRPDLIFRDAHGRMVIVEVQLRALDRHHLYRALEYRDQLIEQTGCDQPRVILFCNTLPRRFETALNTHRVSCITLLKEAFLEKARALRPDARIVDSLPAEVDPAPTVRSILQALQQDSDSNDGADRPDALVLWFSDEFPYDWGHRYLEKFGSLRLGESPHARPYFDEPCSSGQSPVDDRAPRELLLDRHGIEALSPEQIEAIASWLPLLECLDGETVEVVLGYRGRNELYGYEEQIRNQIRILKPLWGRYGLQKGYDMERLGADLRAMQKLKFFVGKFPSLEAASFCESIEIVEGPGPLQENIERRMALVRDWAAHGAHGYTAQHVEELQRFLDEDRGEWVTIRFHRLVSHSVRILEKVFALLQMARRQRPSEDVKSLLRQVGLKPARRLSEIPSAALELSAKYFSHLKGPKH